MGKRSRFPEIKAELKARAAHAKEHAQKIRAASGEERMRLWELKRANGNETRALLLAYTFVRGHLRSRCEPVHTIPNANQAWPWWLPTYVQQAAARMGYEFTRAAFRDWLDGGPSPNARPKPEAVPAVPDEQQAVLDRAG